MHLSLHVGEPAVLEINDGTHSVCCQGEVVQAAQNRLTVNVKISFVNRKYPEDDFSDKSFSAYADFDAMQSLDAVEAELCEEIVEQLCDDIFNATVANW